MKQSIIDLLPEIIFGFEGEDGTGDSSDESSNDSGEQQESAGSGSESSSDADSKADDYAELKRALAAERAANKAKDKQLKAAAKVKEDQDLAKKDEAERERIRAEKAEERATRLASGLLTRDLNAAIEKAAQKAGFIDTDDALAGVDRSALIFEQDEDDPTDITIDLKVIETQVKKLATKKPHFIRTGTDDGEATGSSFGGSKPKKKTSEEADLENYPSLR